MTRGNLRLVIAATGAAAVTLCAVLAVHRPEAFLRAWLTGFSGAVGLSLGALMLLFAHDLTGGAWGVMVRRPLAALAALTPLNAAAVLPVLFGMEHVYPWVNRPAAGRVYLDPRFFIGRAVFYFVVWLGCAWLASRRHRADPQSRRSVDAFSAPALILLGVTTTFSAFDWTMSLQPEWASSIYGLFVTSSDLCGALAAATGAILLTRPTDIRVRNDLASLLLAGILLWAYLALMQFVIIWEENLSDEIGWYLARIVNGWQFVDVTLALCAMTLPGAILLSWPLKARPVWLGAACGLVLIGYVITQWWLVLPSHPIDAMTITVTLGIGAVWAALFDWRLERGRFFGDRVTTLAQHRHV